MTLKDALGFVIDYGKFIATFWNGYIIFVVAVIGWIVTLRGKDPALDWWERGLLIAGYLGVTAIFGFVLENNDQYLVQLHHMLHQIATNDAADPTKADAVKAARAYLDTLGQTDPEPLLNMTVRRMLPGVALLVSIFMWLMTRRIAPSTMDANKAH